jgi:UDP-N-acetylmuramate--alanine ligase
MVADIEMKSTRYLAQLDRGAHIHFIGIGGAGLSAIARVLMQSGYRVSGSDRAISAFTQALADEGATVFLGHRAEQINSADLVIVSSAVPEDNVELIAASARGISVLKRADFLGELMNGRMAVAVAGTHGKTTTTGMIATILLDADQDPTFIVGGQIAHLGTNARAGSGPFVIEADEYDRTFLGLRPNLAVITNVEHDHPDCYPTFGEYRKAFEAFVTLLPEDGTVVVCVDDIEASRLGDIANAQGKTVVGYGQTEDVRPAACHMCWRAVDARPNGAGGSDYVALLDGQSKGLVRLRVPGNLNVVNSLAAVAVADQLGVPFATATQALRNFRGTGRRFEIKGVAHGVTVVDDYAHHPTEIRATLAAARSSYPNRRVWAVWQPHTYSRVKALMDDFSTAFAGADHVLVTSIYSARETNDLGVSGADVVDRMEHPDARYVANLDQAVGILEKSVHPGDVVLTLGAGDGYVVGERLLSRLADLARVNG